MDGVQPYCGPAWASRVLSSDDDPQLASEFSPVGRSMAEFMKQTDVHKLYLVLHS
jgi:hypothetical protein